jgi:predicted alpha-1,2-mannosidase
MKLDRREFTQIWLAAFVAPSLPRLGGTSAANEKMINPLIGASTSRALGEGKTFPGPTTPFGMVQIGPDTITGGDNAPGYSFEHTTIEGFSYMRMSGVGWFGDFGNLLTMPMIGEFKAASGRPDHPQEGWRSRFSHSSEIAECGYYAVTLEDSGIRAELTATRHAGMMQFTFPQTSEARIQVDLARRIGGTSTHQYFKVVDDHSIQGWVQCSERGGGWGNGKGHVNYTLFFHMEFSKSFENYGNWSIEIPPEDIAKATPLIADYFQSDRYYEHVAKASVKVKPDISEGDHIGFFAVFRTEKNEKVLVKTGLSFVDVEGAKRNLSEEIHGWNFNAVRLGNRDLWVNATNKIQIEGANVDQQKIFSTALYHSMIDPRKIADCDGRYRSVNDKILTEKDFNHRTIFSGWDVFRAYFPLMTIIDPSLVNDTISTLVEMAQLSGKGYLERWEIMGAYSGCMDGDPAISVIADAYVKGIRKFDVKGAYAACKQTASGSDIRTNRPDNKFYLAHGFVPNQISWTLDNAYFDWCVGIFGKALGEPDAPIYFKRGGNYANIYDASLRSMRARGADGKPIAWEGETAFGQGCTESNPLQQSWFVPHDVYGLIALMGTDAFSKKLEIFFENTPDSFGWNPYYNHSNEPVHHIPYLFNYVGKPWLTQKWVRRILDKAYGSGVNGICGNDDVGQMSAWYVMSALGFYPVCPGTNVYLLGAPLFEKLTINLDPLWHQGKSFTVIGHHNSSENFYVQSVKLNGSYLHRSWITHEEITAGGTLEFEMGPQPNLHWGSAKEWFPPALAGKAS